MLQNTWNLSYIYWYSKLHSSKFPCSFGMSLQGCEPSSKFLEKKNTENMTLLSCYEPKSSLEMKGLGPGDKFTS